jgi:hypothetical protein
MKELMKELLTRAVLLALVFASASSARAEEQVFGQPMIRIGAASEQTLGAGPMNVMAQFALTTHQGAVLKQFTTAYARLSGEVAFSSDPLNGHLPYLDVEFVPIIVGHSDFEGQNTGLRVLPMEAIRYIPLNEELSIRVSLLGVQTNSQIPLSGYGPDPKVVLYLNMVADLLGYKWVERMTAADGTRGGSLQGLDAVTSLSEVGLQIRFTENLRGRILLGIKSSTTVGRRDEESFAISMRNKLYAQIAADIQNFSETFKLSIFAQTAGYAVFEKGMDRELELQMIFGVQASFR